MSWETVIGLEVHVQVNTRSKAFCGCATDFGAESVHALPWALSLAEEHNARLTLLHVAREAVVLPEPEPGTLPVEPPAKVVETTTRRLRDLLPASTQLKQPPEYLVKFGTAAETILQAAAEHDVDLLVMGVKRPASVSAAAHLGMHIAYKVACEAPCRVLTVSAFYHA